METTRAGRTRNNLESPGTEQRLWTGSGPSLRRHPVPAWLRRSRGHLPAPCRGSAVSWARRGRGRKPGAVENTKLMFLSPQNCAVHTDRHRPDAQNRGDRRHSSVCSPGSPPSSLASSPLSMWSPAGTDGMERSPWHVGQRGHGPAGRTQHNSAPRHLLRSRVSWPSLEVHFGLGRLPSRDSVSLGDTPSARPPLCDPGSLRRFASHSQVQFHKLPSYQTGRGSFSCRGRR